jgi:hypothetical protein
MSELTQEKVDALVAPILKMATQDVIGVALHLIALVVANSPAQHRQRLIADLEDGFRRAIDHGLNEKPRVTQ